jgi:hypothetical protein
VAVNGAGNIFMADSYLLEMTEWIAASNTIISILRTTPTYTPVDVALDTEGDVYIAYVGNNPDSDFGNLIREWKVTDGSVATLVSSGLNQPYGVAVDLLGNVYIADTGDKAVKEWTASNSNVITLVSSGLSGPVGVAVDRGGNVYIADETYDTIREWTAANSNVVTLVSSGLKDPEGVAVDGAGNVYIANTGDNSIRELPHSFVDTTPKVEGLDAGSDSLPPVLPVTENLLPPFAPTCDQSWLTIDGITNGVVSFSFTTNSGPARTAHITLLGQSIAITQETIGTPPILTGAQILDNGALQFNFTNIQDASLTVLSSTNLSLPLSDWTVVGTASNIASGQYQFTSQPVTNNSQLFYSIRSP